ncbi:MAG: purine-nucleoside phosphorylase [Erysipelotrichaceae bacterium]|nr:purine-nucleoside phosphorylase [Erysipelotrichaceae bacterium]MBQ1314659.1 purine-nucleoside phosphorylase [Erysipelotrichaceae bacterium]MBR2792794.1 purine-nucleoside phosphorylase [Erysipelotrichaceae bacterium]MBR6957428.1 purine-nucleoside phosphorylase [Erysipelotrichaceae bacterium]
MSTPHNSANKGDIAKIVLMPGDPLRAKFVAETFLEDPVEFNHVRGMLGYTGTYKGHKVSVMGSGMGMPSIGIYSYELFKFYDVDAIIRIGTTGAMVPEVHIYDIVLAKNAYSKSTYAQVQNGDMEEIQWPDEALNEEIRKSAAKLGYPMVEGTISSSDVFYIDTPEFDPNYAKYGCVCAEMESFALFHNAKALGKKAACLLTVSDSIVTGEETTAEERQLAFTKMMEIALETALKY